MILYLVKSESRYVHRLSDIPKGAEFEKLDIPTDTQGLMGYLNTITARKPSEPNIQVIPVLPPPTPEPAPAPARSMEAEAVLSRMDQLDVNVDAVVDAIDRARGFTLKRYAGAVALRFETLAK